MKLGLCRKIATMAFCLLLMAASPFAQTKESNDPAPQNSTSENSETENVEEEDSFKWSNLWKWPLDYIIQPVLNVLIYPIATPIDYAVKNGVIERSVDLITFGERKNIFIYPSFNLKPGASTELGVVYRHRSVFLDRDYLVLQGEFFANGDLAFDTRYTKQSILGTPLFAGVRYSINWNRDRHFIVPETKASYLQPDSSFSITWRLGAPLSDNRNWNAEIWTTQNFIKADVPDIEDSLLFSKKFSIEDRGLYQDHMEFPIGASIIYDDLDYPYAPSRGSRVSFSGSYNIVSKYDGVSVKELGDEAKDYYDEDIINGSKRKHDYIRTEFLLQHYFLLGSSPNYILSATEARQNRKFYTDFSWDEAIRVWRPENMMQTLFERRVIALQYRLIDLWEMEKGGAPFNAFPTLNARTPLRGYGDTWASHHIMSLSAEYRWPVDRFVDGVVFDEYALIADKIDKWSFDHYYNSWGFGIRVRQPNMFLCRVQLGFHGLHGVNMIITIAPEFR